MNIQSISNSIAQRFEQRSTREQALIILAVMMLCGWLLYSIIVAPVMQRMSNTTVNIEQQHAEQLRLTNEVVQLQQQLSVDPNQPLLEQESMLEIRQQRLQAQLSQRAQLMPKEQSVRWIQALLSLPATLELRSFDALAATPLLDGEQNAEGANLWQHPVEIRIRGQYFHLRDYVEQLDNIELPFYWQQLSYDVEQYPQAVMTLRVYALSQDKELLGG